MKKGIVAVLMAGTMLVLAGCTEMVSADPETGALSINGVPANVLLQDMDEEAAAKLNQAEALPEAESETEKPVFEPVIVFEKTGVTVTLPEEVGELEGCFKYYGYEAGPDSGIFDTNFTYFGVSKDWFEEYAQAEDPSEEDLEKFDGSMVSLPGILAINNNRGLKEYKEYVGNNEYEINEDDYELIKKIDDTSFFYYFTENTDKVENLDPDFKKEYKNLLPVMEKALKNAELVKPVGDYRDTEGKQVSFETTDMDGNKISSSELFSQHEYTMVNVWATWCGHCIHEMPELEEINKRLADKDCAIVGLVGDGTDAELIDEAKRILKENGVTYLNILPWDGATTEDFKVSQGWPASFFVDREGKIVCLPLIGEQVDTYEKVIDNLLAGREAKGNEEDKSVVAGNNINLYRIYVSDLEGNLIEGAMVQFCDDEICRVGTTDVNGLVTFSVDKGVYTAHLLTTPEGYMENTESYTTPEDFCDLHFVLEKE